LQTLKMDIFSCPFKFLNNKIRSDMD
jgi:hypothetical protein